MPALRSWAGRRKPPLYNPPPGPGSPSLDARCVRRAMHPGWLRGLLTRCKETGMPVNFRPATRIVGSAIVALTLTSLTAQSPVRHSTAVGEWPTYGGDLAATKYSPLDQINRNNFSTVKVAWRTKSPDGFLSMTLPGGTEWSTESRLIFD